MNQLNELQPRALWAFFRQISAIPHTSYHEQALIDWILQWAKEKSLDIKQDKVGNLIISKAATFGMEERPAVILQAHMDMVGQKGDGSNHDFLRDPIELIIDGDWLRANNTTLGADNGIGMAACLAVLDSSELVHGPLQVLLTINEEAGMDGAFGLEAGLLQGNILINTDSEQEGEVFMGCAGGGDALVCFTPELQALAKKDMAATVMISGLEGGHSGCDIDSGRANANQLLARLLATLQEAELEFFISDLKGGTLRNAIPREAQVTLVLSASQWPKIQTVVAQYRQVIKRELALVETELAIELVIKEKRPERCFTLAFQELFISAFNAAPNGVIRMSDHIEGVVETSLNLGVVQMDGNGLQLQFLIRSLIDSARLAQQQQLYSLFSLAGAQIRFAHDYPGWQPDPDSDLISLVKTVFEQQFKTKPKLMVIHAGLECGLFQRAYPHCEMVSIGPTIQYPHSPKEKVNIPSVERFWQWLSAILAKI